MHSIIQRFEQYNDIQLKNGQLGFCLEDKTLYIGIKNGFIPISSDSASFEDLRSKVIQLRKDADNLFIELDEKTKMALKYVENQAERILELIGKAKDAKEVLDKKADDIKNELDTKINETDERINEKFDKEIERLDAEDHKIYERINEQNDRLNEKIDEEVDRLDEEDKRINEILNLPYEWKSIAPNYEKIFEKNEFENMDSWKSNGNGYVLISAKGLADFNVQINDVVMITKSISDEDYDPDLSVIFSQVFQVSKGDIVEIEEIRGDGEYK